MAPNTNNKTQLCSKVKKHIHPLHPDLRRGDQADRLLANSRTSEPSRRRPSRIATASNGPDDFTPGNDKTMVGGVPGQEHTKTLPSTEATKPTGSSKAQHDDHEEHHHKQDFDSSRDDEPPAAGSLVVASQPDVTSPLASHLQSIPHQRHPTGRAKIPVLPRLPSHDDVRELDAMLWAFKAETRAKVREAQKHALRKSQTGGCKSPTPVTCHRDDPDEGAASLSIVDSSHAGDNPDELLSFDELTLASPTTSRNLRLEAMWLQLHPLVQLEKVSSISLDDLVLGTVIFTPRLSRTTEDFATKEKSATPTTSVSHGVPSPPPSKPKVTVSGITLPSKPADLSTDRHNVSFQAGSRYPSLPTFDPSEMLPLWISDVNAPLPETFSPRVGMAWLPWPKAGPDLKFRRHYEDLRHRRPRAPQRHVDILQEERRRNAERQQEELRRRREGLRELQKKLEGEKVERERLEKFGEPFDSGSK